jgi:Tfp pilus assembly protein PilO
VRLPANLAIAKGTTLLPVSVSFEGTLAQIVDFQRRMETLPRLSLVESMKLTNDETHPGVLRVDLLLLTYCRPS